MDIKAEYSGDCGEEWLPVTPEDAAGVNSEAQIRLWALVLTARGIPCSITATDCAWQLLVPVGQLSIAKKELLIFEEKNFNWPPPQPLYRQMPDNTLATISVLLLLAIFHNITRLHIPFFDLPAPDWMELGSAKVHLIHYGEWWRLVTALTLHADWLHLISNLTIGGFFVVALCRELGSGLAWTLLLTAGALGNWLNAQVQFPTHSSVGASTAVFGAVGILAAINLVRHRFNIYGRWKLPVAAAVALLALLGTEGKNTDLGAHLFGFMFGGVLGAATEFLLEERGRPRRTLSVLLALLSGLIVTAAWWTAIVSSG